MKYSLTFGRNSQIVWALILPAFILLIPLILVIEYVLPLFPNDSGWLISITTILYVGFDIWITLSWVKATTADVEITIKSNVLEFHFIKRNIFHRSNFNLTFNEIKNIGEDSDKGYNFLYIESYHPVYNKFFIRTKDDNPDFETFSNDVLKMEDQFNKQAQPDKAISNKSIYQKWPMKLMAAIFVVCWFIFPIGIGYSEFNWLMVSKYLVFVVISSPIVYKVYSQNFRK